MSTALGPYASVSRHQPFSMNSISDHHTCVHVTATAWAHSLGVLWSVETTFFQDSRDDCVCVRRFLMVLGSSGMVGAFRGSHH